MWASLASCMLLLCSVDSAVSARILAILPLPAKSHSISNMAILTALAARGHHVTVYSPFAPPQPVANMKHIEVHLSYETDMKKNWSFENFKNMVGQDSYIKFGSLTFWTLTYPICEEFLNLKEIKSLVESKEKFDLVMTEALFGQESMLVFGHIFNAPVINLSVLGPWSILNRIHGNALQIASAPDMISYPFNDQMSFMERCKNFAVITGSLLYYHYIHLPKHQEILNAALKTLNIPPIEELLQSLTITIANVHHLVNYPRSYTGNIIPVGGIHIPQQLPPLPKDIKYFLDSGKKSVILFSLGTIVPVHLMPPEYIQVFINVFRKLPYKILWKTEAENVPNLPNNVMITKWLPQQSVLAHSNCVLFITHGGLMSQLEVLHAGVPVVAIPFFGDQPFNVRLYEHLGVGVGLDFNSLTEDTLNKAILSVVGKPQYLENAKKASELFRHRPMSANDTAVFWTEYVLRHAGTKHLTPHAVKMPWYQLAMLDIAAFFVAVVFVLLYMFKKILSLLWSLCSSKNIAPINKKPISTKKKSN